MFEQQVSELLRKYLGDYVRGLDREALRISVWKGDVVLTNLQLKPDALNALKLPVVVRAGLLGSLRLKVPWNKLGREPVLVEIDRVYVLAAPRDSEVHTEEEKAEAEREGLEAKREKLHAAEVEWLQSRLKGDKDAPRSWFRTYAETILGNLQISITNVHIRYEDGRTRPGHFFAAGATIHRLASFTVDAAGLRTFAATNALDHLRKAVQLQRLKVYFEPESIEWAPLNTSGAWQEDLTLQQWDQLFLPGIEGPAEGGSGHARQEAPGSAAAECRKYLLHPVDGQLLYERRGQQQLEGHPKHSMDLSLEDLSATISSAQYRGILRLLDTFTQYQLRMPHAHLRPAGAVCDHEGGGPRAWWKYGAAAIRLPVSRLRVDWSEVKRVCELRRAYVAAYSMDAAASVVAEIDSQLDLEVCLLFRCLGNLQAEKGGMEPKAILQRRMGDLAPEKAAKGSDWWRGWRGAGKPAASSAGDAGDGKEEEGAKGAAGAAEGHVSGPVALTEEEWEKLTELMGPAGMLGSGAAEVDMGVQLKLSVEAASVQLVQGAGGRGAASLFKAALRQLQVVSDSRGGKTQTVVDVSATRLTGPDGAFLRCGSAFDGPTQAGQGITQERAALKLHHACCPRDPLAEMVLGVVVGPCFITYEQQLMDQILAFLREPKSQTLDPTALQVAAAVQLNEALRVTQEQLQARLLEQRRVTLKLEIDAPKVAMPLRDYNGKVDSTMLIDLGHFVVQHDASPPPPAILQGILGEAGSSSPTAEDGGTEQGRAAAEAGCAALYQTFTVYGRDISVEFMDGPFNEWPSNSLSRCSSLGDATLRGPGEDEEDGSEDGFEDAMADFSDGDSSQPGTPRWRGRGHRRLISSSSAGSHTSATGEPAPVPFLERFGVKATVCKARQSHPTLPALFLDFTLPSVGLHYSPYRHRHLMRVYDELFVGRDDDGPRAWHAPEYQTSAKVCYAGDAARTWRPREMVLNRAYVYILESSTARAYDQCRFLGGVFQALPLAPQHVGGRQHCLALLCGGPAAPARVLSTPRAVVVQVASAGEQERWLQLLEERRRVLCGGHPPGARTRASRATSSIWFLEGLGDTSGVAEQSPPAKKAAQLVDPSTAVLMRVRGRLQHLRLSLAGRRLGAPQEDPLETPLVELNAMGVGLNYESRLHDYRVNLTLRTLDPTRDLLSGGCFLRSSAAEEGLSASHPRPPATRWGSEKLSVVATAAAAAAAGMAVAAAEDGTAGQASGTGRGGRDPGGAGAGEESPGLVSLRYERWEEDSPGFANVDAELALKITTLYFHCNRPTVASLLQFNRDLWIPDPAVKPPSSRPSAASGNGDAAPAPPAEGPRAAPASVGEEGVTSADLQPASTAPAKPPAPGSMGGLSGEAADVKRDAAVEVEVEPDRKRTSFRLLLEVQELDLELQLEEGAGTLALIYTTALKLDSRSRLAHMAIAATLGNLRIVDATFPAGHPYRFLTDVKSSSGASLVELDFVWFFDPSDASYPGHDYQLHGRLSALRVVFLYRFVWQLCAFFSGLIPPPCPGDPAPEPETGAERNWWAFSFNVRMEAPIVTLPRSSCSSDFVELDLGALEMRNRLEWHRWTPAPPPALPGVRATLVDVYSVTLTRIRMVVVRAGARGPNLVQGDPRIDVTVRYPQYDPSRASPACEVVIACDALHAALAETEYAILSTVISENLWDEGPMPAWCLGEAPPVPDPPNGASHEGSPDAIYTSFHLLAKVRLFKLEMFQGVQRASALAEIEAGSFWTEYTSASSQDWSWYISLAHLRVRDIRPDTAEDRAEVLWTRPPDDVAESFPQKAGTGLAPRRPRSTPRASLHLYGGIAGNAPTTETAPSSRVLEHRLNVPGDGTAL
ncbi:hypothetical protein CYMTET_40840 [Cymbomonas tetramitiformis]|uniref:Chorein N-terminal domain-containing protein n=1 Tax=Cymbomonas tetramitiformis TaxID=36881 RepID=A0AAE0C778_9CHLO|nr:hypothetical protein CYMTET_40840 [Cymbomonas tetramitiformis]